MIYEVPPTIMFSFRIARNFFSSPPWSLTYRFRSCLLVDPPPHSCDYFCEIRLPFHYEDLPLPAVMVYTQFGFLFSPPPLFPTLIHGDICWQRTYGIFLKIRRFSPCVFPHLRIGSLSLTPPWHLSLSLSIFQEFSTSPPTLFWIGFLLATFFLVRPSFPPPPLTSFGHSALFGSLVEPIRLIFGSLHYTGASPYLFSSFSLYILLPFLIIPLIKIFEAPLFLTPVISFRTNSLEETCPC